MSHREDEAAPGCVQHKGGAIRLVDVFAHDDPVGVALHAPREGQHREPSIDRWGHAASAPPTDPHARRLTVASRASPLAVDAAATAMGSAAPPALAPRRRSTVGVVGAAGHVGLPFR